LSAAAGTERRLAGAVTEDAFLGGALCIVQPRTGYRAGLDAILLAATLRAADGERVLDVGAGVGVVGLAAARRLPGTAVTLVERDAELAALAAGNIARNGLAERVRVVAADVARPLGETPDLSAAAGRFDHALVNPPFLVEGRGSVAADPAKAAANAMAEGALGRWMRFAAAMLRPRGTLTLIHRADALGEVLGALAGRFGGAKVLPVHPYDDKAAVRVLVRAVKGSGAAPALLPGLVLHAADGSFRPQVEDILRNGAGLELHGEP
jgi:tRNA1(Val) A37 N6-methylase TrmN6